MSEQEIIRQLIGCAERLNPDRPQEAAMLLRVVKRLMYPQRTVMSEYELGLHVGSEDRTAGRRRVSETVLKRVYGPEYIRGYADGFQRGVA